MKEGVTMGLNAGIITIGVRSKLELATDITGLLDSPGLPRNPTPLIGREHRNVWINQASLEWQ